MDRARLWSETGELGCVLTLGRFLRRRLGFLLCGTGEGSPTPQGCAAAPEAELGGALSSGLGEEGAVSLSVMSGAHVLWGAAGERERFADSGRSARSRHGRWAGVDGLMRRTGGSLFFLSRSVSNYVPSTAGGYGGEQSERGPRLRGGKGNADWHQESQGKSGCREKV